MPVQNPVSYGLGLTPLNPAQNIMQGMQVGQGLLDAREQGLQNQQAAEMRPLQMQQAQLGLRTGLAAEADANAQRAMQAAAQQSQVIRQQQMTEAMSAYLANPTPDAANKFLTEYPEHPLSKQYDKVIAARSQAQQEQDFSRSMQVTSAIQSGNTQAGIDLLNAEADKVEAAGDAATAKGLRDTAAMMAKNPQQVLGYLQGMQVKLAPQLGKSIADLKSVDSTVKKAEAEAEIADVTALGTLAALQADLGLKKAQTQKYYADMKNDVARLGLEERKFAAESERAIKELDLKAGEIPANLVPSIMKMSDDAVADDMMADDWEKLSSDLGQYQSSYPGQFGDDKTVASGTRGSFNEFVKSSLGVEDGISLVRRRYKGLMASGVINNLPQGAASDSDVALAKGGFPGETSDPQKLAEFSAAMARINRASAQVKSARAEFRSRNKSAGDARGTFQVQGVTVEPGMSEGDVLREIFAINKMER